MGMIFIWDESPRIDFYLKTSSLGAAYFEGMKGGRNKGKSRLGKAKLRSLNP